MIKWPFTILNKQLLLGVDEAQYYLARMYLSGRGGVKSVEEAFKWYKKAALQGYLEAQYRLAEMYFNGIVELDFKEAKHWWEEAAKRDHHFAQYELGHMLYYGAKGVPKNEEEGIFWLEKASQGGVFNAAHLLQTIHQEPNQ